MSTKYINSEGVAFFAESVDGPLPCFAVIQQMPGFPATEAYDDWFANEKDADEVAQLLAEGKEV